MRPIPNSWARAVLEMVELIRTISMSLSSIDLFGFVRSFVRESDKSVLETSVFVLICSERGSADLTITLKEEGSERMFPSLRIPARSFGGRRYQHR